jgi:hypothetical protein
MARLDLISIIATEAHHGYRASWRRTGHADMEKKGGVVCGGLTSGDTREHLDRTIHLSRTHTHPNTPEPSASPLQRGAPYYRHVVGLLLHFDRATHLRPRLPL